MFTCCVYNSWILVKKAYCSHYLSNAKFFIKHMGERGSEIVAEDLPQLFGILSSLKEQSNDLTALVMALLEQAESGHLSTSSGVSLLDVKYHYLLSYIAGIVALIKSKINGEALKNHPSLINVVECRTTLEKVRPLEQKLRYQIDKILQGSTSSDLYKDDPLRFKPDLNNFDAAGSEEEQESEEDTAGRTGKYVPPHIASMKFEEEETGAKTNRDMEKSKQRALHSSLISELVQETSDMPMELSHNSHVKTRVLKDKEERNRFEEEYMTRLTVSKKQRSAERRSLQRSELDTITKFGNIGVLNDASGTTVQKTRKRSKVKKFKGKKRKFK